MFGRAKKPEPKPERRPMDFAHGAWTRQEFLLIKKSKHLDVALLGASDINKLSGNDASYREIVIGDSIILNEIEQHVIGCSVDFTDDSKPPSHMRTLLPEQKDNIGYLQLNAGYLADNQLKTFIKSLPYYKNEWRGNIPLQNWDIPLVNLVLFDKNNTIVQKIFQHCKNCAINNQIPTIRVEKSYVKGWYWSDFRNDRDYIYSTIPIRTLVFEDICDFTPKFISSYRNLLS